jgi:hypothetical protein
MKKTLTLGLRLPGAIAAAALAALLGGVGSANAGPSASPVGQWDCNINSPDQKGFAFFSFSDADTNTGIGTFTGVRFLVGKHANGVKSSSGPRGGEDIGRGTSSTGSTTNKSGTTNLWGLDMIDGTWQFDANGKIIGRFPEVVGAGTVTCTTNENITTVTATTEVPVTNPDGSITYYTTNTYIFVTNAPTVNCVTNAGATNAVSFSGKSNGKKLTLVSGTSSGKVTYSGTVYTSNLTDLSGYWYANRTAAGQSDLIDFTLEPISPELPNVYTTTNGLGPADSFVGFAGLSKRKQVSFVFYGGDTTNATITATLGTLKPTKSALKANTKGGDTATAEITPVTINAVKK